MRKLDRWELLGLGSILLAALIRFQGLGWESLWGDEAATLGQASKPTLHEVVFDGFWGDPPLYQVMLHEWFRAFGSSDATARVPAAVFGVACVVALYFAGRALVSAQVGALAALTLAILPYHVWYSQQVRSYSLFSMAGLGTFYFLSRATATNGRIHWLGLGAAAALLIHVHYIGFLLLGTEAAVVAAAFVRRRTQRGVEGSAVVNAMLALLVFGVLVAPLALHLSVLLGLVKSGVGLSDQPVRWGQVPSVKDLGHPLVGVFFSNTSLSDGAAVLPAVLLLALLGFGLLRSRSVGLLWPLVACTVAPVAVLGIMGAIWACWIPRFFLMISPMVALAIALGIAGLRLRWLRVTGLAIVVGVSGLSIANMKTTHCRIEWGSAARYVASHSTARPLIVVNEAPGLVARYHPRPGDAEFLGVKRHHWDQATKTFDPRILDTVRQAAQRHEEVWVVLPTRMDSSPALERWVTAQAWAGDKLGEKDFFETRAVGFRVRRAAEPRPDE